MTGALLILFTTGIMVGTWTGAYARINNLPLRNNVPFPWQQSARPKNSLAALYWLRIGHSLRALGYSDAQVQELYKIYELHASTTNLGETVDLNPLLAELRKIAEQCGPTPTEQTFYMGRPRE